MIPLIDSHCHLDDARFDPDRSEVIERAHNAGVTQFVVPAVRASGWSKLEQIAAAYPTVAPAYGLHPWFCDLHSEDDLARLPELLEKAVAVGECGLDRGHYKVPEAEQLRWFRAQLRLAADYDLPLIIHAYKSCDIVLRELRRFPQLRGVVHSFSGSQQQADNLIAQGFYLGIGGAITHPRATRLQQVVATLPLERLLLESDAPDQPPFQHHGQRNEPAFLVEILAKVATIRQMDAAAVAAITNRNCSELFQL